jgi:6-phosphogluconolactonase
MSREIKVLPNIDELSRAAAERFVEIAREAINQKGRFTVALAGGSSPKTLYKTLAAEPYSSQIEWNKTFFFWGDERCVLPESEESNFKMANENLLKPLNVNASNIFRYKTELEPEDAADDCGWLRVQWELIN